MSNIPQAATPQSPMLLSKAAATKKGKRSSIPHPVDIIDNSFDLAALVEESDGQYYMTRYDEPFDPIISPQVPLKHVIMTCFTLIKKHAKDIHNYAVFLGVLISRLPFDRTEIRREVQIQHPASNKLSY